jgi:hypothetical protein
MNQNWYEVWADETHLLRTSSSWSDERNSTSHDASLPQGVPLAEAPAGGCVLPSAPEAARRSGDAVGGLAAVASRCALLPARCTARTASQVGQCLQFANDLLRRMIRTEISGEVIILRAPGTPGSPTALADTVRDLRVGESGFHQGILHDGVVCDNLTPAGRPLSEWVQGVAWLRRSDGQFIPFSASMIERVAF